VIRVFVVDDTEPDPERHEPHVEAWRKVPGRTFAEVA
jgi:hypothetical protein